MNFKRQWIVSKYLETRPEKVWALHEPKRISFAASSKKIRITYMPTLKHDSNLNLDRNTLQPGARYMSMMELCQQGGCACVRIITCGGWSICGHQNSLGPARRSGLCQSLRAGYWWWWGWGLYSVIWCTGAWCSAPACCCNAPRAAAAAAYTGRLDNFPEVEQQQRRHYLEALS